MRRMKGRLAICLLIVTGLYAFHVHLKTTKIFSNPTWDAHNETGQFWSEFAFHYRIAKFFAEHPVSDWQLLARDRDVQYPDTVNDWAEFTVAMEVPVGLLYRWLKPAMPFHTFVVWYGCIASSLSLFAIFFLARALWRSDVAGLSASVLYATLYPSYGRTVKNLFLREDFAIPLILFALYFTVRMLQEDRLRHQVLAALLWLAALASWHLTQFVMAPLVVAAALVYLGQGETPRLPWLVLVMAAGTVLIPVLRAKQVYLSPAMCLLYALALAVWIDGGRKKAAKVFIGALAGLVALSVLLQKSFGEYAHVYQLFVYKLRFFGVKPGDPAMLPYDARVLWEGAFNTAEWKEFWRSLQFCLPLSLPAMWFARRDKEIAVRIFALFALLLFPLAWMVVRYFSFVGFAAAAMAAGLMTRPAVWWKLALTGAAVWQLAMLDYRPLERVQPSPAEYRPIAQWLQQYTPTNAVVLAHISESPVFWAHTGRPIILHSKFENREIRQRFREFLESIYGSEEAFYQFCRRNGADYFVYDIGFMMPGKESRRYKADKLGELDPDSAAMLFQYHPDRLRHFKLETANDRFAIFRVLRQAESATQRFDTSVLQL
jgi:hypothetical protein